MKRRPSADAFFLLLLLLVFAVLSFQISSRTPTDRSEEELHPRRSTYSAHPGGWKAFYTILADSGLPVKRWTRSPSRWSKDAQVVICGPEHGISAGGRSVWNEREAKAATDWVEAGGTLLVFTDRENALTDELKLTPEAEAPGTTDAQVTQVPLQPVNFLHGVTGVTLPTDAHWSQSPGKSVRLLGDKLPNAVVFSRGSGYVIAIASPAMADNKHIGLPGNARFLTQTVAAFCDDGKGKAGPILFDEYHQGYDDEDTLWSAIGRPGQLIVYELLVLCLLIAYTASRRFGLPTPVLAASRVSSEYVRSLADLYRRARAADAALESLYAAFRNDLCRAMALPLDTPVAELVPAAASSLAAGDKSVERRLHQLMDTCEAKISGGPSAMNNAELLPLARDMEALRKQLDLGGSPHNA